MTPPKKRGGRPLERKVHPGWKKVDAENRTEWPITIHRCNKCGGVNSHPLTCTGTFEAFEVVPVEERP